MGSNKERYEKTSTADLNIIETLKHEKLSELRERIKDTEKKIEDHKLDLADIYTILKKRGGL